MSDLAALLRKEFVASSSPTSGLTAYHLEGQTKKPTQSNLAALLKPKQLTSLIPLLQKGDKPGHEFRGNQWTGAKVKSVRDSAMSRQKAVVRLYDEKLDQEPLPQLHEDAYQMMGAALGDVGSEVQYVEFRGRIVSAISYKEDEDQVHVYFLGSIKKGGGAKLLEQVEAKADKAGKPVTLMALSGAAPFYESRGYKVLSKDFAMIRDPGTTTKKAPDDIGPLAHSPGRKTQWPPKQGKAKKFDYAHPETCPCCSDTGRSAVLKAVKQSRVRDYVLPRSKRVQSKIHKLLQKWAKRWAKVLVKGLSLPQAEKVEKGDRPGHPFRGNQYVPTPTTRPDGAPVVGTALVGSPADKRGIKVGQKASYMYVDMHGQIFRGVAEVRGFVTNKKGAATTREGALVDVVFFEPKRNSFLFVDSKNVRRSALKVDLGRLIKADIDLDEILEAIDLEGFSIELMDYMTPKMRAAFKDGAIEARELVGFATEAEDIINLVNEDAVKFSRKRAAELVGMKEVKGKWVKNPNAKWSISETTRKGLRALTTEAVQEGWGAADLKGRILDSYGFSEQRAEMIARTELAGAYVQGNLKGWETSGVVKGKRSILADTHPFEDVCDDNERQGIVPLLEPFQDGSMAPPYHPNCLCDIVPVLDDEMPEAGQEEEKVDLGLLVKS